MGPLFPKTTFPFMFNKIPFLISKTEMVFHTADNGKFTRISSCVTLVCRFDTTILWPVGVDGVVLLEDFEPAERMPMVRGVTTGVSSRALSSELILPAKTPVLLATVPCLQGDKSSSESSGSMLYQNDRYTFYITKGKEMNVRASSKNPSLESQPHCMALLNEFCIVPSGDCWNSI